MNSARVAMPRWLLGALAVGAALAVAAFSPWVVLAIWLGLYAKVIERPLRRLFGDRRRLSASITVILFVLLLAPIAVVLTSIVIDAVALVQSLSGSERARQLLEQLVGGGGPGSPQKGPGPMEVLISQSDRAWAMARQIAGATAHVVIGLLVLVSGIYGVLVNGAEWYAWVEDHAPVSRETVRRFADVFVETGRGLLFGIIGAGFIQAVIATITFLVLGVPQALALGLLTLVFSVIPAIGTALVWIPVTAGLALTGQTTSAVVMGIVGVTLISTADNLARPFLARRGQLQLPAYVVLVAMFGGIEIMGAWGLILGPLFVRLAKEAILIQSGDPPVTGSQASVE